MPAAYLHGSETLRVDRSPRPIQVVRSAVIALIGCAPTGPVNTLTACYSEPDGAQFGPMLAGFSIPDTLDAIYDHSAGTVLVINVLDPTKHVTAVPSEAATFDPNTNRLRTSKPALIGLPVLKNTVGTTTYVKDVDYSVNPVTGDFLRLASGSITVGQSVTLSYSYADPSKVTPADLIGAIDAITGKKSGMKLLPDAYQRYGFGPKLLIAPGYTSVRSVSTELTAWAQKLGAKTLIDAPIGTTRDQAITMRGPSDPTSVFNTSSNTAILCYPHVAIYDPTLNANRLQPLSARAAGAIAKQDLDNGYWWSPSNVEIQGIVGMERDLSAKIDDPACDVNQLNAAGILTVFNSFGAGLRLWGNRLANFPVESGLGTFISCSRVQDIIDESIRYYTLQYMDRPLTQVLVIDLIVDAVNALLRKLRGDGAIIDGRCWFDPDRNPLGELSNGHALFSYRFTPAPPFERGSYESEMTGEYLANLKGGK